MAKKGEKQMGQEEIRVMNCLELNARATVDEIAKSCNFSPQKVSRIMKDLERKEIIWGYSTVTDEIRKNLKHFMVLVKRNTALPISDDVRKEIVSQRLDDPPMDMVKVENIYITHGIADWIFTFYAPGIITAKKFIQDTYAKRFGKFIQEYFVIEILLPIRKQGYKNPHIKELAEMYI